MQVPDTDSGAIEFIRDDDADYYVPVDAEYNPTVGTRHTVNPKEREILIFPVGNPCSTKKKKKTQQGKPKIE